MYHLDEKIQNSYDQYFRGIGIRFNNDDKQTLVFMHKIRDKSTYLRFVNESQQMQSHIYLNLCKFAQTIEKTGGSVAYEYYYDNLFKPVEYFSLSVEECSEYISM